MQGKPSSFSRATASLFAATLLSASGCGGPPPATAEAPAPAEQDQGLPGGAEAEDPGESALGDAPVPPEGREDALPESHHGFGAEGAAPPPPPPEGELDLGEPTREEALTYFGWEYQTTLWYNTSYGYSSLSRYIYPTRATHVLLEAPYGCAPYVSGGAVRRAYYGGYVTLYFEDQVLSGGHYRAEYRIGRRYGYDDDDDGYGYDDDDDGYGYDDDDDGYGYDDDDDGYGYGYDDDDDGYGYDDDDDGYRINGIYLNVYGYAGNVGYGSCPIYVYTRR